MLITFLKKKMSLAFNRLLNLKHQTYQSVVLLCFIRLIAVLFFKMNVMENQLFFLFYCICCVQFSSGFIFQKILVGNHKFQLFFCCLEFLFQCLRILLSFLYLDFDFFQAFLYVEFVNWFRVRKGSEFFQRNLHEHQPRLTNFFSCSCFLIFQLIMCVL